jgi:hypothetical protein
MNNSSRSGQRGKWQFIFCNSESHEMTCLALTFIGNTNPVGQFPMACKWGWWEGAVIMVSLVGPLHSLSPSFRSSLFSLAAIQKVEWHTYEWEHQKV